jgi:cell wall-associated NlpC family hydrolase
MPGRGDPRPGSGRPTTSPAGRARRPDRRRIPRLLLTLTLAVAAAITGGVVIPATQASATIRQRIASAEAQLTALRDQAQRLSDEYDAARIRLAAAGQAAGRAEAEVAAAQRRVSVLQRHVAAFAASAYQGDGQSVISALTSSSPQSFLSKVTALDAVSRGQSLVMERLAVAERQRRIAQLAAAAALRTQRRITTALAGEKTRIEASATRQVAVLRRLRAEQARLIAEARARARRARLAAERRAAERAAAAAAARAAALARQQAATRAAAQQCAATPAAPPPSPPPAAPPSPPPAAPSGPPANAAAIAVRWAFAEIGKPYVWAAAGPDSFDCSGLTQYVWGKAGVYLAHYTVTQWDSGVRVSRANLQPGDLVFFPGSDGTWSAPGHVGIYVGGGNMIDAPYTGVDVREEPVPWNQFVGAVNPL